MPISEISPPTVAPSFSTETAFVNYIFLDVVNFTLDRDVEAQTEIVVSLNAIVTGAVNSIITEEVRNQSPTGEILYIPTGDGMCIALIEIDKPYDVYVQLALEIIKKVHEYSSSMEEDWQKFQVRIGISSNRDNLVYDINERKNVAGAGITTAQRVMNHADGNQILVGQAIHEVLRHRRKYRKWLIPFQGRDKHNQLTAVYQLVGDYEGLNKDVPQVFHEDPPEVLSLRGAYYFAHAIKNRTFFVDKKDFFMYSGMVLLWLLAGDSVEMSRTTEIDPPTFYTFKAGEATLDVQYKYYRSLDGNLTIQFASLIRAHSDFPSIERWYEGSYLDRRFISSSGREKLKEEHPQIWAEFDLDRYVSEANTPLTALLAASDE